MPDAIDELIEREGGFNDDPLDHGGPTKYGITQVRLSAWRGHAVSVQDVKDLSPVEARTIYVQEYLKGPGIDKIPSPIIRDYMLDVAVLSGPETAIMLLQHCLVDEHEIGIVIDGVLGPKTLAALWGFDPEKFLIKLVAKRVIALVDLVQHDPPQLKWLEGWVRRTLRWLD